MRHKKATAQLQELSASALSKPCDTSHLAFETTQELPALKEVKPMIGQPRAYRALELGSEILTEGYNIFALGLPGSGKVTLTREFLERKAAGMPVPPDWCYVFNFADAHQPTALKLRSGQGRQFREQMQDLVKYCQEAIPHALEDEGFSNERNRLLETLQKDMTAEFDQLEAFVEKHNYTLIRAPFGLVLTPAVDHEPLSPAQLEALSPEQQEKLSHLEAKLQQRVQETLNRMRERERQVKEQLEELIARTALYVIEPLINSLQESYADHDQIIAYLEAVKADILSNVAHFRSNDAADAEQQALRTAWLQRYTVNLIVDNTDQQGAPVILESQPTYQNLLGRIEHELVMGGFHTDFTMIRAGALHRAHGGYLILPARDLLLNPYAWEGLKRVLRDGNIRIIELGAQLSLVSTVTLDPEPIPLQVTVVMIGTPLLYYLLHFYDEDFEKLFKIKAEFATQMERTPETEYEYALFVKAVQDEYHLPPFDCRAVARIIEYGARLTEEQDKLSTRFGKIADLIREAAYWAKNDDQAVVPAAAVQKAVEEAVYRSNLTAERIQQLIADNTIMIDTQGASIGQVNALSVANIGDYAFGHPTRLTAAASPGKGGVIDIERKAELGGPIHTKGVLILSGFLSRRYGRQQLLSLSASIAFEQSYQGVEGDSASAAELFALLSAITDIPLRQDIAVTGSINQHGQIQPIGGVNEKIEGFYTACQSQGLTGQQGVIIPSANIRHLMLKDEVVEAVKDGQFHIWPIATVDEGLALLTGLEPGAPGKDGSYPAGTFNALVMEQLAAFFQAVKKAGESVQMLSSSDDSN